MNKIIKKIKVIRYGNIHYHAGCEDCNFHAGIQTHQTGTAEDVRNAVYKHVRRTGHHCWIESGTHTVYTLEEHYL